MKRSSYLLFLISYFLLPTSVLSADFAAKGPLTIRNQNPIYLEFLNLEPSRAVALPKGAYEVRMDMAYSNIFEEGYGRTTSEMLDMELLRAAFHFNAGIYEDMEAGIEIPFIGTYSGFLDGFIQRYHNFFGFPNGGREHVPDNIFNYYFKERGSDLYHVQEQAFLLGDITVNLKHNFIHEGDLMPAVAWQFYFKFPTGSCSKGTGSGDPDFGFAALLEKSYERWHGYLNLGYIAYTGHEYLQDYMNNMAFSYVLAGELSVSHPVSIVAQLSGGTPMLANAGFVQWDSFPMDLQLGAKGEHPVGNNAITWQAAFTEDINPNGPSVDFTVFTSVGYKFGKIGK